VLLVEPNYLTATSSRHLHLMTMTENSLRVLTDAELANLVRLTSAEVPSRAARSAPAVDAPAIPLLPPPGFPALLTSPVGLRKAPGRYTASDTLFIEDIPTHLDDAGKRELTTLLSRHGTLKRLTTPSLKGRQVAFATFSTVEQATAAQRTLNGSPFLSVRFGLSSQAASERRE
jgi:hypothetical protein